MGLPTNRENASIDYATRMHRTRGGNYSLMGPRDRAGGVKSRNHFLASEPSSSQLPKSDAKTHGMMRYAVKVNGRIVRVLPSMTQASSVANTMGGHVSIL